MKFAAIIFDFDGVIADSEALANAVLAEHVTRLGLPTTLEEALDRYMGRRWLEAMALIEAGIGGPLPTDFSDSLKAATLDRFRVDLREVSGAMAFIRGLGAVRRCIASSSSIDRLRLCLDVLGITGDFPDAVFSADMVARGKPYPDIFLHAAERLGVEPGHCLVVEDSISGVKAGKAAGMTVVGLSAGSHIRAGHAQRLTEAGADHIAATWDDVVTLIAR